MMTCDRRTPLFAAQDLVVQDAMCTFVCCGAETVISVHSSKLVTACIQLAYQMLPSHSSDSPANVSAQPHNAAVVDGVHAFCNTCAIAMSGGVCGVCDHHCILGRPFRQQFSFAHLCLPFCRQHLLRKYSPLAANGHVLTPLFYEYMYKVHAHFAAHCNGVTYRELHTLLPALQSKLPEFCHDLPR